MGRLPHKMGAVAALALLVAVSTAPVSGAAPFRARSAAHCRGAGKVPQRSHRQAVERATRCLINAARRAHHRRPLHRSRPLARAAGQHSSAMARRRYFAHGDVVARLRSTGYIRPRRTWSVGENIAWGEGRLSSPRAIVRGWMHSPPHRRNILSRRFREIGVGIATGTPAGTRGATYTTDFGRRRGGHGSGHRARRHRGGGTRISLL